MRIFFFLCYFFSSIVLIAQEEFRVVFYNTENLYDTIRNRSIHDEEFTPKGNLHWNSYRYQHKVESVAQVLSSIGENYPPAIIGLCEVENENVVKDLLATKNLSAHKYKFSMTQSRDERGSNLVLLYQRDQFKQISKRTYRPKLDNDLKTRDILHVTGKVVSGDTLDVFVCHLPSRRGGVKKSEPNRLAVVSFLAKMVGKVADTRKDANLLIMGDFNDTPNGSSFQLLKSELKQKNKANLVNLMNFAQNDTIKSYFYQRKWFFYDQFIVSENLLNSQSSCFVDPKRPFVYKQDYLLEIDDKYQLKKPFRTFSGWKYLEGYSDHLPIYLNLYIKEDF